MRFRTLRWLVAVACFSWLGGCAGDPPSKVPEVVEIRLEPPSLSLVRDQLVRVVATPLDSRGRSVSGASLRFRSEDPSVASVDSRGWVEGKFRGETEIVVTAGGKEARLPVSARLPVDRILLEPDPLEMREDDNLPLTLTVIDVEGWTFEVPPEARWKVADPSVAEVNQEGRVHGKKAGATTVSVASGEGVGTASIHVIPRARSIALDPHLPTLIEGKTTVLRAVAKDRSHQTIEGRLLQWESSDPRIATVEGGKVEAKAPGDVELRVFLDDVETTASLRILPRIAALEIVPDLREIYVGGRSPWTVRTFDVEGELIEGRQIHWSSEDLSVATVDPKLGIVVGVSEGTTTISAASEEIAATAEIRIHPEARLVLAGDIRPREEPGIPFQLEAVVEAVGDDPVPTWEATWSSSDPDVVEVDPTGRVQGLRLGKATISVRTGGLEVDLPFASSLRFLDIAAGDDFSCGLTLHSNLWCWGGNQMGQLGAGEVDAGSFEARRVQHEPGLRFTHVTAGSLHACALTEEGAAWCWGDNRSGALGDTSVGNVSPTPIHALPGEIFGSLSAGLIPFYESKENEGGHTCGITVDGRTLCWGNARLGQMGNGSTSPISQGEEPAGGHHFVEIHASSGFTCGLTIEGEAYCWGFGPLGKPATVGFFHPGSDLPLAFFSSPTPLLSIPELPKEPPEVRFLHLSVGRDHVCGIVDLEGKVYCWGGAGSKKLGTSGYVYDPPANPHDYLPISPICTSTATPDPACAGAFQADRIAMGGTASCGIDPSGTLFCWGREFWQPDPVKPCISPIEPFATTRWDGEVVAKLALGRDYCFEHGCLLTPDGEARCAGENRFGQAGVPTGLRIRAFTPIHPD